MLEVYNEQVQDLLVPPKKRPRGGLKILQHRHLGIIADKANKRPVSSYAAIEEVMTEAGCRTLEPNDREIAQLGSFL